MDTLARIADTKNREAGSRRPDIERERKKERKKERRQFRRWKKKYIPRTPSGCLSEWKESWSTTKRKT